MSTAEVISIISAVIAIAGIIVMIGRNRQDIRYRDTQWEVDLKNRLTSVESQIKNMTPINDRVVRLETQMGVFWNMVEHMSVSQLVHTNEQDKADAQTYDRARDKSKVPTDVLKRLGNYLIARLRDPTTPYDERAFIVLKLGPIQAQLIDRGEEPLKL